MRICVCLLTIMSVAALAWGQQTNAVVEETPAVKHARTELDKVQGLVSTGVLPRVRLEQARAALSDAQDDASIRASLYQKDLSVDQAKALITLTANRVERKQRVVDEQDKLLTEGIIAKSEVNDAEGALEQAKRDLEWAKSRAQLADEMAEIAKNEQEVMRQMESAANARSTAGSPVEHFVGSNQFDLKQLVGIEHAFQSRFAHPLPISAMGETAVHRSLGFDHRNRVDVAIQPDLPEGQWLRKYLTAHSIPYFAFRTAVAHKATGAHIHIGPPSLHYIARAMTPPHANGGD